MAKTGSNFRLSKTTKRMVALMRGTTEQRNQYKRMMIDAEYTASIVVKTPKKESRLGSSYTMTSNSATTDA